MDIVDREENKETEVGGGHFIGMAPPTHPYPLFLRAQKLIPWAFRGFL